MRGKRKAWKRIRTNQGSMAGSIKRQVEFDVAQRYKSRTRNTIPCVFACYKEARLLYVDERKIYYFLYYLFKSKR